MQSRDVQYLSDISKREQLVVLDTCTPTCDCVSTIALWGKFRVASRQNGQDKTPPSASTVQALNSRRMLHVLSIHLVKIIVLMTIWHLFLYIVVSAAWKSLQIPLLGCLSIWCVDLLHPNVQTSRAMHNIPTFKILRPVMSPSLSHRAVVAPWMK